MNVMNRMKKVLSMLMAFAFVFTMLPINVFAADDTLTASLNEAKETFKLEEFTTAIFPSEASFMVKILLEDDPLNKDDIHWSHKKGNDIDIKIGTFCNLQIVTRKRSIFDLLFNR